MNLKQLSLPSCLLLMAGAMASGSASADITGNGFENKKFFSQNIYINFLNVDVIKFKGSIPSNK